MKNIKLVKRLHPRILGSLRSAFFLSLFFVISCQNDTPFTNVDSKEVLDNRGNHSNLRAQDAVGTYVNGDCPLPVLECWEEVVITPSRVAQIQLGKLDEHIKSNTVNLFFTNNTLFVLIFPHLRREQLEKLRSGVNTLVREENRETKTIYYLSVNKQNPDLTKRDAVYPVKLRE